MSCQSCQDEAKEKNRELINLLIIAKQKAFESGKSKAICYDEIEGYFIAEAATAFEQHFFICNVISRM
ncbi:MAG: hypothetical protein NVSMB46_09620 [Candidatus Saccharimonadales bacterium]